MVDKRKKSIELWHGFLIKSLFYMSKNELEVKGSDYTNRTFMSKDAVCSLSKLYSIFFGYSTNIPYQKMQITGYPRNDMLFTSNGRECLETALGKIKQTHIVIYMPTFRVWEELSIHNGENTFIYNMPGFDVNQFNQYLSEHDILFIAKMHTLQVEQDLITETENIRILTDDMLNEKDLDLYELLNGTDCLISDYSSVIIDYLLTDKPMIFTPTDLDAYSETRGLMLEPYDAWMPGDIALDYKQFITALDTALFGEDRYKKDRERLKRITHKYDDAKSTERVLSLARKILGIA
jgi:CDP-glycerol glycerophosphotransferase (TagB/SpsB family)